MKAAEICSLSNIEWRQPSGTRTCRRRRISTVHHIKVKIEIDYFDLACKLMQSMLYHSSDAIRCHLLYWNHIDSRFLGHLKVRRGIGKRLYANLHDVLTRKPVFQQRPHRISIAQS